MQTLKKIYDEEIEFLRSETAASNDKYLVKRKEADALKQDFETKTVRLVSLSKDEQKNISSLIKDGVPQCPSCIVRSGNFHDMTPQNGDKDHDYFSCKTCGLQVEIEI